MKPITPTLAASLAPRLIATSPANETGCWVRQKGIRPNGYSVISVYDDGRRYHLYAHRVMYVHAYGEIPEGLSIDHLCENRACCNPEHLRAVTHRENVLRSRTNPFAINARKTTCNRGHEFTQIARQRRCYECARISAQERRRARKGAA